MDEGIEVSKRRRVDQTNRPRSSAMGQRFCFGAQEVGVGAEGETTLEEVRVMAVEHRVNG